MSLRVALETVRSAGSDAVGEVKHRVSGALADTMHTAGDVSHAIGHRMEGVVEALPNLPAIPAPPTMEAPVTKRGDHVFVVNQLQELRRRDDPTYDPKGIHMSKAAERLILRSLFYFLAFGTIVFLILAFVFQLGLGQASQAAIWALSATFLGGALALNTRVPRKQPNRCAGIAGVIITVSTFAAFIIFCMGATNKDLDQVGMGLGVFVTLAGFLAAGTWTYNLWFPSKRAYQIREEELNELGAFKNAMVAGEQGTLAQVERGTPENIRKLHIACNVLTILLWYLFAVLIIFFTFDINGLVADSSKFVPPPEERVPVTNITMPADPPPFQTNSSSPTLLPTFSPSLPPTSQPTLLGETWRPTSSPTGSPTSSPITSEPSIAPSHAPSTSPSTAPSRAPITSAPSASPSWAPTISVPTQSPSTPEPTRSPTTPEPTMSPTLSPSLSAPTSSPTTSEPTTSPSLSSPTVSPSSSPTTAAPTHSPSFAPSETPTTSTPTRSPSTSAPTSNPTSSPITSAPSLRPTLSPTSSAPTASPSEGATELPSTSPTVSAPTFSPTFRPTGSPSTRPSTAPATSKPSNSPSNSPSTSGPSKNPSSHPTTSSPTKSPIVSSPTKAPTMSSPSRSPSNSPITSTPSKAPSTSRPSATPSARPTTSHPSKSPITSKPSFNPTRLPTTLSPTSKAPSASPSSSPTTSPSNPFVPVPEPPENPFPNGTVLVGGSMHFVCEGNRNAKPVVILEHDVGATLDVWAWVQDRVGNSTFVCAYSRRGYGYSTPGSKPRNPLTTVIELKTALEAINITSPIVHVGHGWGGFQLRRFYHLYPEMVAAMVFVDAYSTQCFKKPSCNANAKKGDDDHFGLLETLIPTGLIRALAYAGIAFPGPAGQCIPHLPEFWGSTLHPAKSRLLAALLSPFLWSNALLEDVDMPLACALASQAPGNAPNNKIAVPVVSLVAEDGLFKDDKQCGFEIKNAGGGHKPGKSKDAFTYSTEIKDANHFTILCKQKPGQTVGDEIIKVVEQVRLESKTFTVHKGSKKTWAQAKSFCESLGGRLAQIRTAGNQEEVEAAVSAASANDDFWIGATDASSQGTFQWLNGFPVSASYSNWASHEPTTGAHDCAEFIRSNRKWRARDCSDTNYPICEVDDY